MLDFFGFLIFLLPIVLGYYIGRHREKKHYLSIRRRENLYKDIDLLNTKVVPSEDQDCQVKLVVGQVVIAIDAFKALSSVLSNLLGGRVKAYESIVDRARREAILRMKESAQSQHACKIINVRIETSTIGHQHGSKGTGAAEAYAYGTAIIKNK